MVGKASCCWREGKRRLLAVEVVVVGAVTPTGKGSAVLHAFASTIVAGVMGVAATGEAAVGDRSIRWLERGLMRP